MMLHYTMMTHEQYQALMAIENETGEKIPEMVEFSLWCEMYIHYDSKEQPFVTGLGRAECMIYERQIKLPDAIQRLSKAVSSAKSTEVTVSKLDLMELLKKLESVSESKAPEFKTRARKKTLKAS